MRATGNLEEAIDLYRRAVKVDPMSTVATGNLASLLMWGGLYDDSEAMLKRYEELRPDADISINLGLLQALRGRYAEALELCQVQTQPGPETALCLVSAYTGLGEAQQADEVMQQLVDDPDFPPDVLSKCHAERGNADQAFALLDEVRDALVGRPGYIEFEPFYRKLHSDPRWEPLIASLHGEP